MLLTILLSAIGSLATYSAVKSGCGRLAFMAAMSTVLVLAV